MVYVLLDKLLPADEVVVICIDFLSVKNNPRQFYRDTSVLHLADWLVDIPFDTYRSVGCDFLS